MKKLGFFFSVLIFTALPSMYKFISFEHSLEGAQEQCLQEVITERILVSGDLKSLNKHELVQFNIKFLDIQNFNKDLDEAS